MKHLLLIFLYLVSFLIAIYFSYWQGYDDGIIDTIPLWTKDAGYIKSLSDSLLLDSIELMMMSGKCYNAEEIKILNNIFQHHFEGEIK